MARLQTAKERNSIPKNLAVIPERPSVCLLVFGLKPKENNKETAEKEKRKRRAIAGEAQSLSTQTSADEASEGKRRHLSFSFECFSF